MSNPQVHSRLISLDNPEAFPLDFHATVSGQTPEEIRQLALEEARDFYGPSLEHTGVHVLSTHVEYDAEAEPHGTYRATVVFRQVTD
ncbi:hypothetical protein ACFSKW_12130 [Nonomuraea mangrovi]|uniref:Uncharacterized protein n=1 Tax=Nonomuraea mangrovi TaxID=2316207 RepID=A0ABW4SRL0_9ACTN